MINRNKINHKTIIFRAVKPKTMETKVHFMHPKIHKQTGSHE